MAPLLTVQEPPHPRHAPCFGMTAASPESEHSGPDV